MIEKVREEMADKTSTNCIPCRVMNQGCPSKNKETKEVQYPCEHQLEIADEILSIKIGNITLKELIEMIDEGRLVKLSNNQDIDVAVTGGLGFKKVEPL